MVLYDRHEDIINEVVKTEPREREVEKPVEKVVEREVEKRIEVPVETPQTGDTLDAPVVALLVVVAGALVVGILALVAVRRRHGIRH